MHDVATWTGDFDELPEADDELCADGALCDRVFASKHEAYLAGRYVAAVAGDGAQPRLRDGGRAAGG